MDELKKRKIIGKYSEEHPKEFAKFLDLNHNINIGQDTLSLDNYSEDGYINIEKIPYIIIMERREFKDARCAEKWILLPDLSEILVKRMVDFDADYDKLSEKGKLSEQVCKYNSLFLPEIFEQLGIESAQYYFAKEDDQEYVITPSVLEKGEHLISGETILEHTSIDDEEYVRTELESIEKYIREVLGIQDDNQINKIKETFIIQVIMSRYLNINDFHSGNWGIVYNKKTGSVRSCPMIDSDNSLDDFALFNRTNLSDKQTDIFEDIFRQYSHIPAVKDLLEKLNSLDLEKAIDNVYTKKGISIPSDVQDRYIEYFEQMKKRTLKLYDDIYNQYREKE